MILGVFFKMVIKKLKLIKIKLEYINITKKKKKKHAQIHEVFKISFTSFHLLKSLYDVIVSLSIFSVTSLLM